MNHASPFSSVPQATVVLAAGGTGGHLFPAEGLAEVLISQGVRVVLITDKRFANYTSSGYKGALSEVELYIIRAGSLGGSLAGKVSGVIDIGMGICQARSLLKKLQPRAVVGFGGYPSFPTMFAATRMGLPTIIHEQNALLGRANRKLASRVGCIAASYPDTGRVGKRNSGKLTVTGNPVRASIRALQNIPYSELPMDGTLRLLITGGSQGASIFSRIVPSAMATLPAHFRSRIRIDQQCRPADIEVVREAYNSMGVSADLATFFADIPARLAAAHLVVARAGASTVAELSVAGRPGILVPLPSAADNHQMINAMAFEQAGAGWVIPEEVFTAAALAARIEACLTSPSTLSKAAKNAHLSGHVNAAAELAALVMGMAQRSEKERAA